MSDRPTPETDALILSKNGFGATDHEWREHSRKLERERDEWYDKAHANAAFVLDARKERDEARELCRELNDLVAYGLGQSGEPWSLDAMRQAADAIQKVKGLEESK